MQVTQDTVQCRTLGNMSFTKDGGFVDFLNNYQGLEKISGVSYDSCE
jgi:hypothetical protein